jgi:hypothetical protein
LGPVVQHTGELEFKAKIEKIKIFGIPDESSQWVEIKKEGWLLKELPETIEIETLGNVKVMREGSNIRLKGA